MSRKLDAQEMEQIEAALAAGKAKAVPRPTGLEPVLPPRAWTHSRRAGVRGRQGATETQGRKSPSSRGETPLVTGGETPPQRRTRKDRKSKGRTKAVRRRLRRGQRDRATGFQIGKGEQE
jgi:hypothetical protein